MKQYPEMIETDDESLSIEDSQTGSELFLKAHLPGNKVFITDQSIEKVRMLNILDHPEANIALWQFHKELLKESQKYNNSDEIAAIMRIGLCNRTHFIYGTQTSVFLEADADAFHLLRTSPINSLVILHNHPGLSYFSLNDVNEFLSYSAIAVITIVTNQGQIWYLKKTKKFDFEKLIQCMENLQNHAGVCSGDELVEKFLQSGYSYGIERN